MMMASVGAALIPRDALEESPHSSSGICATVRARCFAPPLLAQWHLKQRLSLRADFGNFDTSDRDVDRPRASGVSCTCASESNSHNCFLNPKPYSTKPPLLRTS